MKLMKKLTVVALIAISIITLVRPAESAHAAATAKAKLNNSSVELTNAEPCYWLEIKNLTGKESIDWKSDNPKVQIIPTAKSNIIILQMKGMDEDSYDSAKIRAYYKSKVYTCDVSLNKENKNKKRVKKQNIVISHNGYNESGKYTGPVNTKGKADGWGYVEFGGKVIYNTPLKYSVSGKKIPSETLTKDVDNLVILRGYFKNGTLSKGIIYVNGYMAYWNGSDYYHNTPATSAWTLYDYNYNTATNFWKYSDGDYSNIETLTKEKLYNDKYRNDSKDYRDRLAIELFYNNLTAAQYKKIAYNLTSAMKKQLNKEKITDTVPKVYKISKAYLTYSHLSLKAPTTANSQPKGCWITFPKEMEYYTPTLRNMDNINEGFTVYKNIYVVLSKNTHLALDMGAVDVAASKKLNSTVVLKGRDYMPEYIDDEKFYRVTVTEDGTSLDVYASDWVYEDVDTFDRTTTSYMYNRAEAWAYGVYGCDYQPSWIANGKPSDVKMYQKYRAIFCSPYDSTGTLRTEINDEYRNMTDDYGRYFNRYISYERIVDEYMQANPEATKFNPGFVDCTGIDTESQIRLAFLLKDKNALPERDMYHKGKTWPSFDKYSWLDYRY